VTCLAFLPRLFSTGLNAASAPLISTTEKVGFSIFTTTGVPFCVSLVHQLEKSNLGAISALWWIGHRFHTFTLHTRTTQVCYCVCVWERERERERVYIYNIRIHWAKMDSRHQQLHQSFVAHIMVKTKEKKDSDLESHVKRPGSWLVLLDGTLLKAQHLTKCST